MSRHHVRFNLSNCMTFNENAVYSLLKNAENLKPVRNDIQPEQIQIACQIGTGKFADVFLAIVDADCFALKIFKPSDPQRYKDEKEILLKLMAIKIPNIPRLISLVNISDPPRDAFLMDLIADRYSNRQICELNFKKQLLIIKKLLETLYSMGDRHSGIIHGNICPNNIVVDSSLDNYDNLVNVLLVGWSHSIVVLESSYTTSNKTNQINVKICGGNFLYKAPELLVHVTNVGINDLKNMKNIDKIDIWSIGCLFAYYLLGEPIWKKIRDIPGLPDHIHALYNIANVFPKSVLSIISQTSSSHIGIFSSILMKDENNFQKNFLEHIKKSEEEFKSLIGAKIFRDPSQFDVEKLNKIYQLLFVFLKTCLAIDPKDRVLANVHDSVSKMLSLL